MQCCCSSLFPAVIVHCSLHSQRPFTKENYCFHLNNAKTIQKMRLKAESNSAHNFRSEINLTQSGVLHAKLFLHKGDQRL